MARTYRFNPIKWDRPNYHDFEWDSKKYYTRIWELREEKNYVSFKDNFIKKRDSKPWNKPPKWFKKMHNRIYRAKCKEALYRELEFPVNKNCYQWLWT